GSAELVARRSDQDAGAAGLAPHPDIGGARRRVAEIAGDELAIVDPQLALQEVKLLDAGVTMRRIRDTRLETHEHADAIALRVRRQQLAPDARRGRFPCGLGPLARRLDQLRSRLARDLLGDAVPQLRRRIQHLRRPRGERCRDRLERLQLLANSFHERPPPLLSAFLSLARPARMRVLMVPSGTPSCAAVSVCVRSAKYATSIAARSPAVSDASASCSTRA